MVFFVVTWSYSLNCYLKDAKLLLGLLNTVDVEQLIRPVEYSHSVYFGITSFCHSELNISGTGLLLTRRAS